METKDFPTTARGGHQRVVLLGPPASGKGTQGRSLAESLGLDYLSTGALLRHHVANKTDLGLAAAPILARGAYLPDDLMEPILADWLDGRDDGWVLDGFPRSLPQARWLDDWLAARAAPLDAVISLDVPYPVLLERILDRVECPSCRWSGNTGHLEQAGACPKCGKPAGRRADDTEENLARRHREYDTITGPVVEWYRHEHSFISVDATAPPDEVAERLLARVAAIRAGG